MNIRKYIVMLLAIMAYVCHAQQQKPLKIWKGTPERAASVTLTPYIPQGAGPDCPAVIVCPGGSYHWLDTRTEGDGVARWLNSKGIAAFVLRYRVAGVWAFVTHYRLLVRGRRQPDMLRDVQRSVQLVREGASTWGINPNEVGVMGFSAGGHLAVASRCYACRRALRASPLAKGHLGRMEKDQQQAERFAVGRAEDTRRLSARFPRALRRRSHCTPRQ